MSHVGAVMRQVRDSGVTVTSHRRTDSVTGLGPRRATGVTEGGVIPWVSGGHRVRRGPPEENSE